MMESTSQLLVSAAATALTATQDAAHSRYQQRIHVVREQYVGLLPWLKRAAYILLVICCLTASSLATYGLFYVIIMPSNQSAKPLYFDYSGKKKVPLQPQCTSGYETVCNMEYPENVEKEQLTPEARVDLFARRAPWEAFQEEVVPRALTEDRLLQAGQAYFVEVELLMPETERNRQLGMFTIEVELRSDDAVLARSIRSARFPYESSWLGVARKLLSIAPLLLGGLNECRKVVITPFDNFVESEKHPLHHVRVKLAVPPDSPFDARHVEVVSGQVRIGRELNDVQRVLSDWFFTCYAVGTMLIFAFKLLLWTSFQYLWDARSQRRRARPSRPKQREYSENNPSFEWEGSVNLEFDDDEWDDISVHRFDETQQQPNPVEPIDTTTQNSSRASADGEGQSNGEAGVTTPGGRGGSIREEVTSRSEAQSDDGERNNVPMIQRLPNTDEPIDTTLKSSRSSPEEEGVSSREEEVATSEGTKESSSKEPAIFHAAGPEAHISHVTEKPARSKEDDP